TSFVFQALVAKAKALTLRFNEVHDTSIAAEILSCYRLAEKVLSGARARLDMEDAKWAYVDTNFDLYETELTFTYELFRQWGADSLLDLAFHHMEASKARSLSNELHRAEFAEGLKDSLFERRSNLKAAWFREQDEMSQHPEKEKSARDRMVELD